MKRLALFVLTVELCSTGPLCAALVDLKPGLFWNDETGVLSNSVQTVPVETLRIDRNHFAEFMGSYSAAAERLIFAVSPGTRTSTFSPTNDLYYFGLGDDELASASNRVVSGLRITPDAANAARSVIRSFYSFDGNRLTTSINNPQDALPTFNWTNDVWGALNPLSKWSDYVRPFCVYEADATNALKTGGQNYNLVLSDVFDSFYTASDWRETAITNAVFYSGGFPRPTDLDGLLDWRLRTLYPDPPAPAASNLLSTTRRFDRLRLTAIDYAAAMADRWWGAPPSPVYNQLDGYYANSITATGVVSTTWTYNPTSSRFEFSIGNVNWHTVSNIVVSTNDMTTDSMANIWCTGSSDTNATWDIFGDFAVQVSDSDVQNAILGLNLSPGAYAYSTLLRVILYNGVLSVTLGPTSATYYDGETSWGESDESVVDLPYTTPARIRLLVGASRGALVRMPTGVRDPYDGGYYLKDQWADGIISGETVWNICSRWDETDPTYETHECKISAAVNANTLSDESRLISIAGISALDEAADMAKRHTGGISPLDIGRFLAIPAGAIEDAKDAAESVGSVNAPDHGGHAIYVDWIPDQGMWIEGDYVPPGEFWIGIFPGAAGGEVGSIPRVESFKVGAKFTPYALRRLSFWNCRP